MVSNRSVAKFTFWDESRGKVLFQRNDAHECHMKPIFFSKNNPHLLYFEWTSPWHVKTATWTSPSTVHSEAPRHPIPTPSRFKVNTPKVEDALSIKLGQVVGAVLMTIKFLKKQRSPATRLILQSWRSQEIWLKKKWFLKRLICTAIR